MVDESKTEVEKKTLFDRLGGDDMMNILVWSFLDELMENPDIRPFYKNISMVALKTHTLKLFKVLFGKYDDMPEEEDLLEYLLKTHTRLFRELGLNETHFDTFLDCFVDGLKSFQTSQGLIDECMDNMRPLRIVFEYGAQVAKKEKEMPPEQLKSLPPATASTIGTDKPVILPEISNIEVPSWLPKALGGTQGDMDFVRKWTCELTNRFGAEGDSTIADTFLAQPYMDHHIYNVAFLELAFLPEDTEASYRKKLLQIVLYPRGRKCAPLSRHLFDRMVTEFAMACQDLGMPSRKYAAAQEKLRTFRSAFSGKTVKVGGATCPHILSKAYVEPEETSDKTTDLKHKKDKKKSNGTKSGKTTKKAYTNLVMDDDSASLTSLSTANSNDIPKHKASQKGGKKNTHKMPSFLRRVFRAGQ